MDKLLISRAFKTLDEVTTELKESVNPNALDLDELSDKYVGMRCTVDGKDGEIKSLAAYRDTFEKSLWQVILDDGTTTTVLGREISLSLTEKLPGDLGAAYKIAYNQHIFKSTVPVYTLLPNTLYHRNEIPYDFDKADYKKISKEEALNYKGKAERSKLRVIIYQLVRSVVRGEWKQIKQPYLVMWDNAGNLLNSKQALQNILFKHGVIGGKCGKYGSANSFKDIINAADTIYVTNEHDLPLPHKSREYEVPQDLQDIASKVANATLGMDNDIAVDQALRATRHNRKPQIDDTGNHGNHAYSTGTPRYENAYYAKRRADRERDIQYTRKLNAFFEAREKAGYQETSEVERARKDLYVYAADNAYQTPVSLSVARFILFKEWAKLESQKILNMVNSPEDALAGDDELDYNQYMQTLQQQKKLKAQQEGLKKKIAEYEEALKGVVEEIRQNEAYLQEPSAAKKIYEERAAEIVDNAMDEVDKLNSIVDDTRQKIAAMKKRGGAVKESLDNDCNTHLRIYTVDQNGAENFIDDDLTDKEEAFKKVKELARDENYARVCLIRVIVCPEGDDNVELLYDSAESLEEDVKREQTFGELIDSIIGKKEESLKESKSFNLKDSDRVVDALAYKEVGKKTDDSLVVVDPSIESEDDKMEPHVGDAILQCERCKTAFFLPVDQLEKDEESELYNKEMACPHCNAKDGFKYLYQVAAREPVETDENSKEEENEKDLPAINDDFVDMDKIDEVKEESFEKLVNPYLTKLYENVSSFKTTNISQVDRNTLKIEGNLKNNEGKEKLVEFLFTKKENKNKEIIFEGYNSVFTKDPKAYVLKATLENNNLVFESFAYKYNKQIDGKDVLIEGIEK